MAWPRAAVVVAGLLALQTIFAVVIAAISKTTLVQDGTCILNPSGKADICEYLAVTSYFSLGFGVLLALFTVPTLRAGSNAFLPGVNGSIAFFGLLFWLAAAISATKQGQQASDEGLPEGTARNAVAGLAWIQFVLYVAQVVAVASDGFARKRARDAAAGRTAPMLSGPPSDIESGESASEFKHAVYEAPHVA